MDLQLDADVDMDSRVLKDLVAADDRWMVKEKSVSAARYSSRTGKVANAPDELNWDEV